MALVRNENEWATWHIHAYTYDEQLLLVKSIPIEHDLADNIVRLVLSSRMDLSITYLNEKSERLAFPIPNIMQ